MNCREFTEHLDDYLAAETRPEIRRPFQDHLLHCPDCAAYLDAYRQTIRLVHATQIDAPLSEFFIQNVLSACGKLGLIDSHDDHSSTRNNHDSHPNS